MKLKPGSKRQLIFEFLSCAAGAVTTRTVADALALNIGVTSAALREMANADLIEVLPGDVSDYRSGEVRTFKWKRNASGAEHE